VEALEDKSNDYVHNQVKVTKEAREVMLHNCMKRKVYSRTKEAREVLSNDYDHNKASVA
jgi:homoserine kinase